MRWHTADASGNSKRVSLLGAPSKNKNPHLLGIENQHMEVFSHENANMNHIDSNISTEEASCSESNHNMEVCRMKTSTQNVNRIETKLAKISVRSYPPGRGEGERWEGLGLRGAHLQGSNVFPVIGLGKEHAGLVIPIVVGPSVISPHLKVFKRPDTAAKSDRQIRRTTLY